MPFILAWPVRRVNETMGILRLIIQRGDIPFPWFEAGFAGAIGWVATPDPEELTWAVCWYDQGGGSRQR